MTALQFAVLVWGSLALVAVVFAYELLAVWRDWKERPESSS